MKFSPTAFAGHFFYAAYLGSYEALARFFTGLSGFMAEKKRSLLLLAAASIISINWLAYIHVIYSSITHSCFLVSLS